LVVGVNGKCYRTQGERQQREIVLALVAVFALEAENEAEQVDAEGYHPEERDRRDVLAHVRGECQQHDGGASRESNPET
jgi:hypothetical protein